MEEMYKEVILIQFWLTSHNIQMQLYSKFHIPVGIKTELCMSWELSRPKSLDLCYIKFIICTTFYIKNIPKVGGNIILIILKWKFLYIKNAFLDVT